MRVEFSLEERAFYSQLEADSRKQFKVCMTLCLQSMYHLAMYMPVISHLSVFLVNKKKKRKREREREIVTLNLDILCKE